MKKAAVLLLAAGLVFGAVHKGAQAADIKVSGEWDFNTEWNNIGFAKEKTDDLFHARQRLRTQVDIIASESLKMCIRDRHSIMPSCGTVRETSSRAVGRALFGAAFVSMDSPQSRGVGQK